VPQGQYINDPEVLREAGSAAGVEDYEKALSDPSVALDQVRFWGSSFAKTLDQPSSYEPVTWLRCLGQIGPNLTYLLRL